MSDADNNRRKTNMRTKRIKIYKFSELSKAAKDKAIEKFRYTNVEHDWYDFIYEDATEVAKLMGIEIDKIYFSGFSSQGDGACFEGSYSYEKGAVSKVKEFAPNDEKLLAIAERLQTIQKKNFYKLSAKVKHKGHYYHEKCTDIEVFKDGDYMYFEGAEQAESEIIECLRDLMKWIYKRLNDEYDHQTTDAAIIESIEINNYEFLEDGTRSNF